MSVKSKNTVVSGATIQWIDGVRAILTIWILLFHYTLCFINKGFVGFGSNYPQEEALNAFTANLPLSIFTNSSFALYMFMVLISFINSLGTTRRKAFVDRRKNVICGL